jgi:hypothetical protein
LYRNSRYKKMIALIAEFLVKLKPPHNNNINNSNICLTYTQESTIDKQGGPSMLQQNAYGKAADPLSTSRGIAAGTRPGPRPVEWCQSCATKQTTSLSMIDSSVRIQQHPASASTAALKGTTTTTTQQQQHPTRHGHDRNRQAKQQKQTPHNTTPRTHP